MKNLSICIPVYNRAKTFYHSLKAACDSSLGFEDQVEIVVSDNCSEDDILTPFDSLRSEYPNLAMRYHRNETNVGLAGNFKKVVSLATGTFCWIVGSDDFVRKDGVKRLISIINSNRNVGFIACNYNYLQLDLFDMDLEKISDVLEDDAKLLIHKAPKWSRKYNELSKLIDPWFRNVYLGAMMAGVFRKALWDKVTLGDDELHGFNTLKSLYPHCVVYASSFMYEESYYCGHPVITVGEGAKDWATDTGKSFWDSTLPLIYFNIFHELICVYHEHGLSTRQFSKCMLDAAFRAGRYMIPLIVRRRLLKKPILNGDKISLKDVYGRFWRYPTFYAGMLLTKLSTLVR